MTDKRKTIALNAEDAEALAVFLRRTMYGDDVYSCRHCGSPGNHKLSCLGMKILSQIEDAETRW